MAETPKVAIVRTGLANLASILAGFRRAGAEPFVTEDPREVQIASHVVLPGVGAFGPAMEKLNSTGIADVLRKRFGAGHPTLSVCLGLQLLHASSEESPGVEGLGIIPLHIKKFPNTVRIPQLGWNEVMPESSAAYLQSGFAYFANSFHAPTAAEGWTPAHTSYGVTFVSAVERGAWLACQFHPELSGDWGLQLLKKNWLSLAPKRIISTPEHRRRIFEAYVDLILRQMVHDKATEARIIVESISPKRVSVSLLRDEVVILSQISPKSWNPMIANRLRELCGIESSSNQGSFQFRSGDLDFAVRAELAENDEKIILRMAPENSSC